MAHPVAVSSRPKRCCLPTASPTPRSGFSLLSLLLVVAVIAILAVLSVPNFQAARGRSNERAAMAEMKTLAGAMEMYNLDHNSNVTKLDRTLLTELQRNGYIQQAPSEVMLERMNQVAAKMSPGSHAVVRFEPGANDGIVLPSKQDWLGLARPPAATPEVLPEAPLPPPPPAPVSLPGFVETQSDPLSTFGLEVDTGSYTRARAALEQGQLPRAEEIRVEEVVNFFEYGYALPQVGTFGIRIEGAPSPYDPARQLVRIGVQAREIREPRPPAHLTFVVDVSGSMGRPERLPLVKQALRLLVENLRPDDRVCLVTYGADTGVLLPHTEVRERSRILHALDALRARGSTNVERGLVLGYREATREMVPGHLHRVILTSDGLANQGATSVKQILEKVAADASEGVLLTTVGFGMGRYRDSLMEQLADAGEGVYAYVDRLEEAHRIFVDGLEATLRTVAQEARVQVAFDPEKVRSYRLLGYENRAIADSQFRADATVDAGEIGAGHAATALYELDLAPGAVGDLGTVHLRWREGNEGAESIELSRPIPIERFHSDLAASSPSYRLARLAARFAEWLRADPEAHPCYQGDLGERARALAAELPNHDGAQELSRLVLRALSLAPVRTTAEDACH